MTDDEFEDSRSIATRTEVLRVQVGSRMHGVSVGDDDDDEMGICIEPPQYALGMAKVMTPRGVPAEFEQWTYHSAGEGNRSGAGDLDLTVYSLRKWVRLALAGNPTILLPLFVPPDAIRKLTGFGSDVLDQRDRLLSRQVARSYLGYMRQQGLYMRPADQGGRGRRDLIERYGWDTKFGYHLVRLGMQGYELLTEGTVTLPIPEPSHTWLLNIRNGEVPMEQVLARAEECEDMIKGAVDSSPLPEHPDHAGVNAWVADIYQRHWRWAAERTRYPAVQVTEL